MKRTAVAAILALTLATVGAMGCGSSQSLPGVDGGAGRKVGCNVEGLQGAGLELKNLGADEVAIGGDGLFAFPTRMAPGAAYLVTVAQQPTAPAQTCSIAAKSCCRGCRSCSATPTSSASPARTSGASVRCL